MPRLTALRATPIRLLVSVVVMAVVAACGPAPLEVSGESSGTGFLRASLTAPLKGERFEISGDIGTTGPRTVVLETQQEDGWTRVPGRKVTTGTTGTFRFDGLTVRATTRFRARAGAARVSGENRDPVVTSVLAIAPSTKKQRGRLGTLPEIGGSPGDGPRSMTSAKAIVAARFSPSRPGRPVEFAGRTEDGSWRVVGTGEQDAEGRAHVEVDDASAATQWRARAVEINGLEKIDVIDEPDVWEEKLATGFDEDGLLPEQWSHRQLETWLPSRTCMLNLTKGVDIGGRVAKISTAPLRSIPDGMSGRKPRRVLQDERCADATGRPRIFSAGQISTADSFRFVHGVAAARVRFDERAGQHGAFWLQTNELNDTEIDVIESYGRSRQPFRTTLHQATDSETQTFQYQAVLSDLGEKADDWFDKFHIFSVEWRADHYVFRIDGREIFRAKKALSDAPHYVVLSNVVADYEIGKNDGTGSTMEVDWVRVWQ